MKTIKFTHKLLKTDLKEDLRSYIATIESPIKYNSIKSIGKEYLINETAKYYNIDVIIKIDEPGEDIVI